MRRQTIRENKKNKRKTNWPPLFSRSEATSESILLANTYFQASQFGEEFPKKLRRTKKTRKNKKKQVENKLATIIFQVGGDLGVNPLGEHVFSSFPAR